MQASIFHNLSDRSALNRRITTVAASAVVAVILSGCIGASSSFQLPPNYGHQPDGNYLLSSWERGLNCTGLHLALDQRFKRMLRIADAEKTARKGLPRSLMEAVSWKNGNPTGYGKRFKSHQLLKAEALSLHRSANAKNCPQRIDLVQQFAETKLPGQQQPGIVYKTATGQSEVRKSGPTPAAAAVLDNNTTTPSKTSLSNPAL